MGGPILQFEVAMTSSSFQTLNCSHNGFRTRLASFAKKGKSVESDALMKLDLWPICESKISTGWSQSGDQRFGFRTQEWVVFDRLCGDPFREKVLREKTCRGQAKDSAN